VVKCHPTRAAEPKATLQAVRSAGRLAIPLHPRPKGGVGFSLPFLSIPFRSRIVVERSAIIRRTLDERTPIARISKLSGVTVRDRA
jgi:hypothetical protein